MGCGGRGIAWKVVGRPASLSATRETLPLPGKKRTDSCKLSSDLHDIMPVRIHTLIVVIGIKDLRPQNNCGDVNHLDLAASG